MTNALDESWPGSPSYVVVRLRDGRMERVAESGDLGARRPWASVSKMAVAMAVGVEVDWGLHSYEEVVGPEGATLAHLMSHASGLGLEEGDRVVPPGTRRVYSNCGIDRAVAWVVGGGSPVAWLEDRVFRPLGLTSTALEGRPSADVVGSTDDLARLAEAWLRSDGLATSTRQRVVTPFLADLAGIVPGFGRFTPCPWGLGPEVRGLKEHWMGDWPAASFGHFGQSGALLLVNLDEGLGVAATSTEPFGPWAVELWPRWASEVRARALAT